MPHMAVQRHEMLSLTLGNLQQNHCICIKAMASLKVSLFSLLTITPRPCTILPSSMRRPLTGRKPQSSGKRAWMKRWGRQGSAGCSARWRPSGYLKTGEWTASTACLRRPRVKNTPTILISFLWTENTKNQKDLFFPVLCSSVPLTARMSAILCDSGGHKTREDFFSGGLPADTAGASAYCTIQRWGQKVIHWVLLQCLWSVRLWVFSMFMLIVVMLIMSL